MFVVVYWYSQLMNLFSAGCCIANRCCNTLEFAWQNVTHHKSGLSNSHPRLRTAYHSLWMENFENLRVMPVLGIVRLCNLYNKSSTWVCLSAHVSPDLWSCYECTMAIVYHKKPQKVIVIPCKTVMRWQRKGLVVLVCTMDKYYLGYFIHGFDEVCILNVHTPHEQFSNSVR